MRSAALILHRLLEAVTIGLLVTLAGVVVSAVIARYVFNSSFRWYDEVASVLLAWITYYGAALATLQRRHLGFSGFLLSREIRHRSILFVIAEAVVYAVFISMAWASWHVLGVMAGETLVSLEWVSLQFTQSVVPIGCVLFVIAQVLSTPGAWDRMKAGRDAEAEEIEEEIAKAEAERRAREAP
jgi:TRAP-type C4-dicarboxylate transport system permease small subunit